MDITLEVDYSGLVQGLIRAKAYHSEAGPAATLVMAEFFVGFIDRYMAAHHDTNRYINGWISALHSVGLTAHALKPYKKSGRHDKYIAKLQGQLDTMLRLADRLERGLDYYRLQDALAPPREDGTPRKKRMDQPHAIKKQEQLRRLEKDIVRARRELRRASEGEAIIFFDRNANERRRRELHTVRHKIYGGAGNLIQIGHQVIVELANREPHVRLVEAHPKLGHPVKAAYAALRHIGLRRASKKYMDVMAEKFGPPKPTDALSIVNENEIAHLSRLAA